MSRTELSFKRDWSDSDELHNKVERNRDKSMFLLTDKQGRKICKGTYAKCDRIWSQRLNHNHYTQAGIIWFLYNNYAFRMPGY